MSRTALEDGEDRQARSVTDRLVAVYRPLHKTFTITVACYYAYVSLAHFFDLSGVALATLVTISASTALLALAVWRFVASREVSVIGVELTTGLLHLFMLLNVIALQVLQYEPAKLIYFPLLSVAYAMSSISNRTVVAGVALALGSMLALVFLNDPASLAPYVFISIATGVTAIGLSIFLRGVIGREVRERVRSERAEIRAREMAVRNGRLANADFLTGLPNRRALADQLEHLLASGTPVNVGILDLDGFKRINDAYGHVAGDQVLLEVARRLQVPMALPATVARVGGDEFAVLIAGEASTRAVVLAARELVGRLKASIRLSSAVATIGGSMGLTQSMPGDTAQSLLDRADYAAYEAKHRRRGDVVLFSDEHARRIAAEREIEAALVSADLDAEIRPVYQPVFDAFTGKVCGYEALARWQSPTLGPVSPATFIPIAERLCLVPAITHAMLRHALDFAGRIPAGRRVSVNLSVHDLSSGESMLRIASLLEASRGAATSIDFEITETAIMHDLAEATEALLLLKAFGCGVWLDDFGTGHSSLSRVQLLPLDCIKIDGSFVREVETSRASHAIVKTTLDLANNLGITCIVEGVETEAQYKVLAALGARHFQGYFFGHPLPAADLLAEAAERSTGTN